MIEGAEESAGVEEDETGSNEDEESVLSDDENEKLKGKKER